MYNFAEYYEPYSLQEVFKICSTKEPALIVAGGTDVFVKMRDGKYKDSILISLRNIPHLRKIIELPDGSLSIGAMVRFNDLAADPNVYEKFSIIRTAAQSMGGPQIRNMATIGGNLCNGAPSADSAPSLLVLDASLKFESSHGLRQVSIHDFYCGPYEVNINNGEVLTAIIIPDIKSSRKAGHYIKYSMRKAMDIAMLSCAAFCILSDDDDNDRIKKLRIALGTAAPRPIRCNKAEELAGNEELNKELLEEIGRLAVQEANPRSSWRASREYREDLILELTKRTVEAAYGMAKGVK